MKTDDRKNNFMQSRVIEKFWTDKMRIKAAEHFDDIAMVTSIFEDLGTMTELLHECLNNPDMSQYILWLLGSDLYRQRIIQKALNDKIDNPDDIVQVYRNLAALEVQKRNFLAGERFYRMAQKMEGSNHDNYFYLRIYLLYISGKIENAFQVRDQYLNVDSSNKSQRVRKMNTYWKWLESTKRI